jgi:glycerol-3-phosphate cytidylyltransferase
MNTFVIGVFDACHIGHINLLLQCYEFSACNRLTIGVCSDELVEQTKGSKPLYNQDERSALLQQLSFVDRVVVYTQLDLTPWLEDLRPNIWVVPPGYVECACPDRAKGIHIAKELNISVRTFPRTVGISTSNVRARVVLQRSRTLRAIACDFHDTLTYAPEFFKAIFRSWTGPRYIITGDSDYDAVSYALADSYGMNMHRDYDELLVCEPSLGLEGPKGPSHFENIKQQKRAHILAKNIAYYFDDNPIYCEYLRETTCVFSVTLNDAYIREFREQAKHQNVHFQTHVHDFIKSDKAHWQTAADFWGAWTAYPPFPHVKQRRAYEVQYILRKLNPDSRDINTLVDVGCGDGSLVKCLDQLMDVRDIHCYDFAQGLLAAIPDLPHLHKHVMDLSVVENHTRIIAACDVLVCGGMINYLFDDETVVSLLRCQAKHAFIRAACTLKREDERILKESANLGGLEYACVYRTLGNTRSIIERAGLDIRECTRLYPEAIESAYDTRQFMFYCGPSNHEPPTPKKGPLANQINQ